MNQQTEYGIQHKTSKRWLGYPPSKGPHVEVATAGQAHGFEFMAIAEAERMLLDDFADAWSVELLKRA